MKNITQILSRLESLSSSDRQWIVERLPDNAKALLMDELTGARWDAERSDIRHRAESLSDVVTVERVPPQVAADVLDNEAPWLIAIILHSASPEWITRVISSLPVTVRSPVQNALRETKRVPVALLTSLHNTLIAKATRERSFASPVSVTPKRRKWFGRLLPGATT